MTLNFQALGFPVPPSQLNSSPIAPATFFTTEYINSLAPPEPGSRRIYTSDMTFVTTHLNRQGHMAYRLPFVIFGVNRFCLVRETFAVRKLDLHQAEFGGGGGE